MTMTVTHCSIKWRLIAPFFLLLSPVVLAKPPVPLTVEPETSQTQSPTTAQSTEPLQTPQYLKPFQPFNARYDAFRSGKKLGSARRYLKENATGYELGYSSDVSYLVFSDKRSETSWFVVQENQILPERYLMQRTGTGKDRHYEVTLNRETKEVFITKQHQLKAIQWNPEWLDALNYQMQLIFDLRAGKQEFHYQVLNRDGNERNYHYKVVKKELLLLPYGQLNTLKIVREDKEKIVQAWIAPELDYQLVRLWQSEGEVEQFDIQLAELTH